MNARLPTPASSCPPINEKIRLIRNFDAEAGRLARGPSAD